MPIITDIEDVFTDMLLNCAPFTSAIPAQDDPADHVLWMATFEDEIDVDVFRPFAICLNDPFGGTRNTEGSDDIPMYESGLVIELQRNHEDFDTDEHKVSRRKFKEWYGAIYDDLVAWRKRDMRFLQFGSHSVLAPACRTELSKRDTEEDFWAVTLHFIPDGGAGE